MTFDEYQDKAKLTDIYPAKHAITCHALGISDEAGEVAGKIKKVYRDNSGEFSYDKKIEIAYELGDVLWYVANLALDIGITLENIAKMNIDKLTDRKNRNKIQGSGDHR